jgi:tryptophan-rich sensory protein
MLESLPPMQSPWLWSLAVCLVSAGLEVLLSGKGIRARLAELQMPIGSPPLWVWTIIGVGYYVLFFAVLQSLLSSDSTSILTPLAIATVILLLAANAAWNWVFFRKKDLWLSVVLFLPYPCAAAVLGVLLFLLGSPLRGWFLVYVGYLGFALWWNYRVFTLNVDERRLPR